MRRAQSSFWTLSLTIALGLVAGAAAAAPREEVATLSAGAGGVEFRPLVEYEKLVLTISGPGELRYRRELAPGQPVVFGAFTRNGQPLPDGGYTYELLAVPRFAPEVRQRLAEARRRGDERAVLAELRQAGKLPPASAQSGSFAMVNGGFVVAGSGEEEEPGGGPRAAKEALRPAFAADQVIADDLIVQGSECVGVDCVSGEAFSFDTVRLKEFNTRITFIDTSTTPGAPNQDWQLRANDSTSGGAGVFTIDYLGTAAADGDTPSTTPFLVEASAANNSLYIDSTGRVGFRTTAPALDLHVATDNTPAMRLEQTNAGSFDAQTWDVAGNEASFFVRDATGSTYPFRIRPGAPSSSIDIAADGDVGVGTASPSVKLEVEGSNGATKLLVEENSGTQLDREVLEISNNGNVALGFENRAVSERWAANVGTNFLLNEQSTGGIEMTLTPAGNMTIEGTTYATGSSRELKENFKPVDGVDVLKRLVAMPLTEWNAKSVPGQRHIGPVAEEWYATFGLGPDDKHVTTTDLTGVSLAAIQGLYQMIEERDAQIAELQARSARLAELERQLEELRALLTAGRR